MCIRDRFRAAFALLKNKQETTQETGNINDGLQSSKTFGEEGMTNKIPTIFPPFGGNLESKVASIEKKLEILDDLPSNGEILQRAKLKKDEKISPVADMWQFININRRLGATEIGIEKVLGTFIFKILPNCKGEAWKKLITSLSTI